MKSKNIYTKLLLAGGLLISGSSLTSCDDFLTILPTDQLPEENFWQDKSDLENVRAGAYEQLSQGGQTSKILLWGEIRSDNLALNNMSLSDINYLQDAVLQPNQGMFDWSGFYTGINFCNLVIEQGKKMTERGKEVDPSFTRMDYRTIRTEMLALRSLYYFYLVRAYRDVPYVTKSVREDGEAKSQRPAATPGVAILGECIDSLEANIQYAAENFGSKAENKGRFTKIGVHALLADMYLWRACLLKNYRQKDLSLDGRVNMSDKGSKEAGYVTSDSVAVTNDYCNDLSKECLNKSVEHSSWVISKLKDEYNKRLEENLLATKEEREQPYPLYLNVNTGNFVSDEPYQKNFGQQNSYESILELQYDASTTFNSTVTNYLSKYENGEFKPSNMAIASNLLSNATSVNPTIGFGKTDFRLLESADYKSTETKKPITKFVMTHLSIPDIKDLTDDQKEPSYSARTPSSQNAHWPIYRLADMMLIKAEAIARTGTDEVAELREGFRLVNQLFKRNNPALVATEIEAAGDDELVCDRVHKAYGYEQLDSTKAYTKTATDLLNLVYRERQREFVAEGKRWFDIVRQAEASNDPKNTLSSFISLRNTVRNRLQSNLWGFYNPIYNEELKVNGVENGGSLVQNPVWDRYTKK